jgi:hypothetical protein
MDLSHTDLSDMDLSFADVSGTNFSSTDLSGTNASNATFSEGTVFRPTNITGATFDSADFHELDFRRATLANASFREADFTGMDLSNVDFSESDLTGAIFDKANCRHAKFVDTTLERASFIECDLRSTVFTGSALYRATFTDSKMNVETTDSLFEVETYIHVPDVVPWVVRLGGLLAGGARVVQGPFGSQHHETDGGDTAESSGATPTHTNGGPRPGPSYDLSAVRGAVGTADELSTIDRFERAAWVHRLIHRHLVRTGRVRKALEEKHYLIEQRARVERARHEARRQRSRFVSSRPTESTGWTRVTALLRPHFDVVNGRSTAWLTTRSESLLVLSADVVVVAVLFTAGYLLAGSLCEGAGAAVSCLSLSGSQFPDFGRVFLFSLFTLLGGVYAIVEASFGKLVSFEVFDPLGGLVQTYAGLADLRAEGVASDLVSVERALGALLIIPFTLLVVQRIGLYFGSGVSKEGLGGGLMSWLRGR